MKKISDLSAAEAIMIYKDLGLTEEATLIKEQNAKINLETLPWPWNRPIRAWEHTSYAYGFIADAGSGTGNLAISDARNITADNTLKNKRITVSLDYFRVFDYPGRGIHRVLFKFNAKNQFATQDEDVNFNQTFAIQEGQRAPISGYPIFIGLNTGTELVQFNVEIVNVSNDSDEKLLNTINSGTFTNGLKLIGSINPVVPIVTEYAKGITEMLLSRNKNVGIVAPKMGLYFGTSAGRMKMARGMYIAIQMSNPDQFDWSKWIYNRDYGTIQAADGSQQELPYNYFAFTISETNSN